VDRAVERDDDAESLALAGDDGARAEGFGWRGCREASDLREDALATGTGFGSSPLQVDGCTGRDSNEKEEGRAHQRRRSSKRAPHRAGSLVQRPAIW
jgi:hypothetical protein